MEVIMVAVGSAIGGVLRHLMGLAVLRLTGPEFPYGTIAINVIGSFIIGLAAAMTVAGARFEGDPWIRLFVIVGLCGGFTTFSSFSLQTVALLRIGRPGLALANVVVSVALCLAATMAGYAVAGRA